MNILKKNKNNILSNLLTAYKGEYDNEEIESFIKHKADFVKNRESLSYINMDNVEVVRMIVNSETWIYVEITFTSGIANKYLIHRDSLQF